MRPLHVGAGEEGTDSCDVLSGADALVGEVNRFSVVLHFVVLRHAHQLGLCRFTLGLAVLDDLLGLFDAFIVFFLLRVGQFSLSVRYHSLGGVNSLFQPIVMALKADQFPGNLVRFLISGDVVKGRAGDNQRRPGLVDQDRIDLVDNGVHQITLHHLGQ